MENKYRIKEVWQDDSIWYQPRKKAKWLWFVWWEDFDYVYARKTGAERAIDDFENGQKFKSVTESYTPGSIT